MSEVLLPPWIAPQAENSTLIDDSTSVFRAAYAAGNAQRVGYADPRLQVKQSFKGLRGNERAAMLAFLSRAKGKLNTVRALVGYSLRGSFPVTELLTNNDFSNGATGWTASAEYSIAALDHGIRATRAKVTASSLAISQSVARVIGTPYSLRGFLNAGRGNTPIYIADNTALIALGPTSQGMNSGVVTVPASASGGIGFLDTLASNAIAGNFFDAKWASFSKCAQVDNGVNLLTFSDDFTNAAWTAGNFTVATGTFPSPQGLTEADKLTENTASSVQHFVQRIVTVSSVANDFTFGCFIVGINRGWAALQLVEQTGGTAVTQFFNLSTGVLGTGTGGANFAFINATIQSCGNNWYYCTLTGRKTNAATGIAPVIYSGSADTVTTYAGTNGLIALQVWRATMAQSSVAVQPIGTSSSATAGTSQLGNTLNLKGLPVSTSGLLFEGDPFEVNGELKLCQSALNSDASGLGFLTFGPSLCHSPADGDGIIINKPMGKFILAADASWANDFGVYADVDITLEAINE